MLRSGKVLACNRCWAPDIMDMRSENAAGRSARGAGSFGDGLSSRSFARIGRLRALLVFAVLVPLGLLAGQAVLRWNQVWTEAAKELSRTADAAAEHSLRVLETHRIALARVNDVLRGLADDDIRAREQELHEQLRGLLTDLPLVQTLAVNDRHGGMLLTANVFPVPREVNVSDREWIRDLRADSALRTHVSRVYVGRLDQYLFFAVSRRRTETGNRLPAGTFDGAINIPWSLTHLHPDSANLRMCRVMLSP
jgi:hypothetical protein